MISAPELAAYSSKKGQIHVPPKKKGKGDYSYSRRHCRNENETIPEKLVPDDKSAKTDKDNAMEKKIPHDPNEGRGNKRFKGSKGITTYTHAGECHHNCEAW